MVLQVHGMATELERLACVSRSSRVHYGLPLDWRGICEGLAERVVRCKVEHASTGKPLLLLLLPLGSDLLCNFVHCCFCFIAQLEPCDSFCCHLADLFG